MSMPVLDLCLYIRVCGMLTREACSTLCRSNFYHSIQAAIDCYQSDLQASTYAGINDLNDESTRPNGKLMSHALVCPAYTICELGGRLILSSPGRTVAPHSATFRYSDSKSVRAHGFLNPMHTAAGIRRWFPFTRR